MYLRANNEHLYTSDPAEVNQLVSQGWINEGVSWVSPTNGEPVYRLYSPAAGEHHYTKDSYEVEVLASNGWTVDNHAQPIFYSGGSKPIYRAYHEGTKRHHLTTDESEYHTLIIDGWNREGIALYAVS